MIKPQSVPDLTIELIKAVNNRSFNKGITNNIYNGMLVYENAVGSDTNVLAVDRKKDMYNQAALLTKASTEVLNSSTLYFCDSDMSTLVKSGALALDGTDAATPSLCPVDTGICYFAKGIKLNEDHTVHAISWRREEYRGTDLVILNSYNDTHVEIDGFSPTWAGIVKDNTGEFPDTRWAHGALMFYRDGEALNPLSSVTSEELVARGINRDTYNKTFAEVFHSFLLMLQQPPELIETSVLSSAKKASLKRAKKHNVSSNVLVVDIRRKRRPSSSGSGESSVEYNVRWIVTGHWRWQPIKDKETGLPSKKRIWINPYVKGPEDKPLHETKRVYALLK
jgi:hypothetical protein